MANGPGKYNELTTMVRKVVQADGVVLIIVNGMEGSGFSVQMREDIGPETLATWLETMAGEIRASVASSEA